MSRWGDEKSLFFITCYRNHECLWNPMSSFYKNREARASAYSSLLEQFNDDTMTVQMLKMKIKNVRTTYHQELNKIKYSKLSGAAQVYKPTLVWFDAMDSFLGETMKKDTQTTDKPTSKQIDNFKRKQIFSSKPSSQTSTVNNLEYKQVVTPLNEQEPARKQIKLVAKKRMSRQDDETDSEKSYYTANLMENTSTVANATGLCEDEFHFFGMNVAAQLRRLPLHTALQLQTEFQNTLYLARVGHTSLTGDNIEGTTMQTNDEDLSDSDSIDLDVDDKEFSLNIQNATERSVGGSQVSDEETVFKKSWDASETPHET